MHIHPTSVISTIDSYSYIVQPLEKVVEDFESHYNYFSFSIAFVSCHYKEPYTNTLHRPISCKFLLCCYLNFLLVWSPLHTHISQIQIPPKIWTIPAAHPNFGQIKYMCRIKWRILNVGIGMKTNLTWQEDDATYVRRVTSQDIFVFCFNCRESRTWSLSQSILS